jgi:copper(I)-binding protein
VTSSSPPRVRMASAIVLGAALVVCGVAVAAGQSPLAVGSAATPASTAPATLSADGAWTRVNPMVDQAGVAYMVLHNNGSSDDALVAVTSPAAATVELNETVADPSSGMMGMQPVAAIPVPAGGTTELKEGGYHLMLVGLVAPLVEGTTIELTLTFQSGSTLTVPAQVRSGMPMGSSMPMASTMPMGPVCPVASPCPSDPAAQ